jgi:hypothetical protein
VIIREMAIESYLYLRMTLRVLLTLTPYLELCLQSSFAKPLQEYSRPSGLQHWQVCPVYSRAKSRHPVSTVIAHENGFTHFMKPRVETQDGRALGELTT